MSQIWDEKGTVIPVTRIECVPNKVLGKKTKDKDGYEATIISNGKITKEFRNVSSDLEEGAEITVASFACADKVKVIGKSKGKGFQGVVKRHGFSGGGASHGHRHDLRKGGSIGSAFPQHVQKGKKMAGRMGQDRVSTKNMSIVEINGEKNILLIKGAVPGRNGETVFIRKT